MATIASGDMFLITNEATNTNNKFYILNPNNNGTGGGCSDSNFHFMASSGSIATGSGASSYYYTADGVLIASFCPSFSDKNYAGSNWSGTASAEIGSVIDDASSYSGNCKDFRMLIMRKGLAAVSDPCVVKQYDASMSLKDTFTSSTLVKDLPDYSADSPTMITFTAPSSGGSSATVMPPPVARIDI